MSYYTGVRYKGQRSVYLHRIVAEKLIGRELKRGEQVHHIDKNKKNNDPSNLMVFVSAAAHTCFHEGGILIPTSEPHVFDCKSAFNNRCIDCGKLLYDTKGKRCRPCFYKHRQVVQRPTKDVLVRELQNLSFVKVGKKYGVSDNTIRKWLKAYGVDPKTIHQG